MDTEGVYISIAGQNQSYNRLVPWPHDLMTSNVPTVVKVKKNFMNERCHYGSYIYIYIYLYIYMICIYIYIYIYKFSIKFRFVFVLWYLQRRPRRNEPVAGNGSRLVAHDPLLGHDPRPDDGALRRRPGSGDRGRRLLYGRQPILHAPATPPPAAAATAAARGAPAPAAASDVAVQFSWWRRRRRRRNDCRRLQRTGDGACWLQPA